ncbi:MAG: DNA mismatch repair protein MutS [Planctomycetota bacterium]
MSARAEYEARLAQRQASFQELRRRDDNAVSFRTAVFCVGILIAWVVLGGWGVPWQFLLLPVVMFAAAVIYHEIVKQKQAAAKRSIGYYERCLARLDGNWSGVGPDGREFADPGHPYSGDLDIFGVGSLFQLVNLPITPGGARTLAQWLAPPAAAQLPTTKTILDRQEAVGSLRDQTDLRERLAAIGPTEQSQQDAAQLNEWLANPGGLTATWVRLVGMILGLAGTAALVYLCVSMANGSLYASNSLSILFFTVLVQLGFLYVLREPLSAIKQRSEHAVHELRRLLKAVALLETIDLDAAELHRLRNELNYDGAAVSAYILQIERNVSQFDNTRRNLFFAPLMFVTMTTLHFAYAIDRWRTKHGSHVDGWFSAIGQLEALLAFSQLHYENPDYCFPTPAETAPSLTAKRLSHPLLPKGEAIPNDIHLDDQCRMLLVSGSNMSGKSTMLRSVGINTALAWAGAPVCAQEMAISRLQVAAAMRIQDSLQTGTSHFFAELKRIQLIVELAESSTERPVLFLLDEILHGTNSHDRLVGARGVIESLLKSGAVGLVTTHDLALGNIVAELETPTKNVHVRDEWAGGRMTFDYRMRDGVVPKSNALSLMRLLGLDV